MALHPFHTDKCPEVKNNAGPLINFLASFVGIVAPLNAVPQIVTIFKNQSVANVSLLTYIIVLATQVVWLVYARKLLLKPLIVSSVVVIFLCGIIVLQFFIYA